MKDIDREFNKGLHHLHICWHFKTFRASQNSRNLSQSSESSGWSNSQESQSFSQDAIEDDFPNRKKMFENPSSQILLQILCELAQLKAKIETSKELIILNEIVVD